MTLKGLRRLRRKDLLLFPSGPPLAGDLLLLECDDLDESKERRLLLARVLRKIPLRLRFFKRGGLGGLPGETPSGNGDGEGDVQQQEIEDGCGVAGIALLSIDSFRLDVCGPMSGMQYCFGS